MAFLNEELSIYLTCTSFKLLFININQLLVNQQKKLSISKVHTGFARQQVKSTTDTSSVGTRKAIPVSLLEKTRADSGQ